MDLLEKQIEALGEDDPSMALTLTNMGRVLERQGNCDEAMDTLERAFEIQLKKLGEKHAETAKTYFMIGGVLVQQDNGEEAEKNISKGSRYQAGNSVTKF